MMMIIAFLCNKTKSMKMNLKNKMKLSHKIKCIKNNELLEAHFWIMQYKLKKKIIFKAMKKLAKFLALIMIILTTITLINLEMIVLMIIMMMKTVKLIRAKNKKIKTNSNQGVII